MTRQHSFLEPKDIGSNGSIQTTWVIRDWRHRKWCVCVCVCVQYFSLRLSRFERHHNWFRDLMISVCRFINSFFQKLFLLFLSPCFYMFRVFKTNKKMVFDVVSVRPDLSTTFLSAKRQVSELEGLMERLEAELYEDAWNSLVKILTCVTWRGKVTWLLPLVLVAIVCQMCLKPQIFVKTRENPKLVWCSMVAAVLRCTSMMWLQMSSEHHGSLLQVKEFWHFKMGNTTNLTDGCRLRFVLKKMVGVSTGWWLVPFPAP